MELIIYFVCTFIAGLVVGMATLILLVWPD